MSEPVHIPFIDISSDSALSHAWEFVEHTSKSVFLTGKAGTGKTTFLHHVVQHSKKRLVVVAPTGVAAVNAKGVTIHSFFQLPFSPFVPGIKMKSKYEFRKEKLRIIRTLDLLIIDEISMVRSDLLDAIDFILRKLRKDQRPFGGVQLVMIGDLQQLTPVVTAEEEPLLRQYYTTPYFFDSTALQQVDYVTIELTHVFRQTDDDFVAILNRVRTGLLRTDDIAALNARYIPDFVVPDGEDYIRLTTHNASANRYNEQALSALEGHAEEFDAIIKGVFPEYAFPTDVHLSLKVGAQVMFVKNDSSSQHRYYNGLIGHVTALFDDAVCVRCPGEEEDIYVEYETWENTKYSIDEQTREIVADVQGRFVQLPLRLAWAITIHKSQGLTFNHAIIEANHSFAPGQVYVALSRCRTLDGIVLAEPLSHHAIINDHRVDRYIVLQEQAARQSIAQLPQSKEEYYRILLTECFTFTTLMQVVERTYKLVVEHLRQRLPQLAYLYEKSYKEANETIQMTSWRWTQLIATMDYAALTDDSFQQRIHGAYAYFTKQLETLLLPLIEKTLKVKVGNKETAKRLKEVSADFNILYLSKVFLFTKMSGEPFTIERYLRCKQHALLDALDGKRQQKKRSAAH